jgi:hypothetical protein
VSTQNLITSTQYKTDNSLRIVVARNPDSNTTPPQGRTGAWAQEVQKAVDEEANRIRQQPPQQQQQQLQHAGQPGNSGQINVQRQEKTSSSDEDELVEVSGVTYILSAQSRGRRYQEYYNNAAAGYGTDYYYYKQDCPTQQLPIHDSTPGKLISEDHRNLRSRMEMRQRRHVCGVIPAFVLGTISRDNTTGNDYKRSQCMAILGSKHSKPRR